jgi:hypothetical protein
MQTLRANLAPIVLTVVIFALALIAVWAETPTGYWLGAISVSLCLYALKKRLLVAYALIELAVALYALHFSFPIGRGDFSAAFSDAFTHDIPHLIYVAFATGCYLLVQALSNLDKGCSPGTAMSNCILCQIVERASKGISRILQ